MSLFSSYNYTLLFRPSRRTMCQNTFFRCPSKRTVFSMTIFQRPPRRTVCWSILFACPSGRTAFRTIILHHQLQLTTRQRAILLHQLQLTCYKTIINRHFSCKNNPKLSFFYYLIKKSALLFVFSRKTYNFATQNYY